MPSLRQLRLPLLAMILVITASNIAVQFPINDWLTWGAFTYPAAFLVTDLTNRRFGPGPTRRVVYAGFAIAVLLSAYFAGWRIAAASGSAFLASQLLDIGIFERYRRAAWWRAPLISSLVSSVIDTFLFFGLAFAGAGLPWLTLALGDLLVKWAMAGLMVAPYRALMNFAPPLNRSAGTA